MSIDETKNRDGLRAVIKALQSIVDNDNLQLLRVDAEGQNEIVQAGGEGDNRGYWINEPTGHSTLRVTVEILRKT